MRVFIFGVVLLALALPVAAQEGIIEVPLAGAWNATPGWTGRDTAAKHDCTHEDGVLTLRASGAGRTMVWTHYPRPNLDVSKMRFVSLRYRLTNVDPDLFSYLLYCHSGEGGGMLAHNLVLAASDLIHDGEWHPSTTTLHPFGRIGTMALRFRALEEKEGRLEVAYLRFSAEPPRNPLRESLDWAPGEGAVPTEAIPLDAARKSPLPEVQKALSLSDWFPSEQVAVNGVSFRVPTSGAVAASTPAKETQWLSVPVGRKAGGVYLLLGAGFPYKMLGYDGWRPGDMTDRPEQFRVAIRYADGSEEEQVPFCLGARRHGVWRGLQAYALAADPKREIREIALRDGMVYSSFHLVAAATADRSVVPEEPEAPRRTPAGRTPPAARPSAALRGGRALLRNASGEAEFDLSRGASLVRATNARHPDWRLRIQPGPLFRVKEGEKLWSADSFAPEGAPQVKGTVVRAGFHSDEAKLAVDLSLEAQPDEFALRLRVKNLAPEPRSLDVLFPSVATSLTAETGDQGPGTRNQEPGTKDRIPPSMGTTPPPADLWYLYPTMCPVWSNADRAYDTPYSGHFPVQFQDVYDRARGGGLYLGTRDRSLRQRYYLLRKEGSAAMMGVEYRHNPPLPPGEWVEYPVSVLGIHGGDWRPALAAYQRWLAGWCKPSHQRPEWYRHVWNFRTWWTHTMGKGEPERNLYDTKKGEYQTDAFLKRDREQFGRVDMVHFFDWRISEKYGRWGDYLHYDGIGGLGKFRGTVSALQKEGVRVGLYLDCYLCSRKSEVGQAHGEAWALHRENGRVGTSYSTPDDPMLNMCVRHPGWQDHLVATCVRAARETGADGIYLDEGMTDLSQYWCWRKDHGHPVPGTNQEGLLELARKVRAALPANVALYAEWAPPDAVIPHLDGAYQASLRFSDIALTPGFLQLHRFAFPDFRLLTISNAGSMSDGIWEGTKYNFFNGVPLYSLSWGHDEECLPFYRKISRLLQEHEEAFLTPSPRPWVETERHGVYCNEFAGAKEAVWTLWNRRYRSVAGPVLRVEHVPGARYRDLWNDRDLKPTIEKGMAVIETTLGPRAVGAVARIQGK